MRSSTILAGCLGALVATILAVSAATFARGSGPDTGNRTIPYDGVLEFNGVAVSSVVPMTFRLSDGTNTWSYGPVDVAVYSGRFAVLLRRGSSTRHG
jgi:hypothetical protein